MSLSLSPLLLAVAMVALGGFSSHNPLKQITRHRDKLSRRARHGLPVHELHEVKNKVVDDVCNDVSFVVDVHRAINSVEGYMGS